MLNVCHVLGWAQGCFQGGNSIANKAVMTVVTLCDVTVNLPNMTVPLKTVTDVTALLHFVTV
jgi:hypothetical protein